MAKDVQTIENLAESISRITKEIEESFYDLDFGDDKVERKLRKCLYKLGIKSARRQVGSINFMGNFASMLAKHSDD